MNYFDSGKNEPLVSICCITYNHEPFIREALNSLLMQKTNFAYKVTIGEDCSTDNTRAICEEYAIKHPKLINLLPTEKNLGVVHNFTRTLNACPTKYIALCEGDDYWTDPYKLQKQVDFLEANPEYGLIATGIELIDKEGNSDPPNQMLLSQRQRAIQEPSFFDLLKGNLINTLTVCVRADIIQQLAERANAQNLWYVIDYWFWLNIAIDHKIYIMDDVTAAYRVHPEGVSRKSNFLNQRMGWIRFDTISSFVKRQKSIEYCDYLFLYKSIVGVFRSSSFGSKLWRKTLSFLLKKPTLLLSLIQGKTRGISLAKQQN